VADTATITKASEPLDSDKLRVATRKPPPSVVDLSRRRFTIAVLIGIVVVLPVLFWLLWDLWSGSVNPLRSVPYDNFYDLQARAMFHGRLNLPPGQEGIEAFVHNGRQYTYFGLFPSLIRMPILLVTSSLDGKLTGPSILLAWMTTAVFSSLLLWRLRILMRGRAIVGRAEAASYGVLMATIMGGSVILFLAATPFIYNEDFAWSVPLTVGSILGLLGVMERPTWGRVTFSGILILCANLDRAPAGWGCVIGAGLVAVWFALGRGGPSNRRWMVPVAVIAVVPFLVSCAATYAKFGIPIGLPMADQIWASVNAHRRQFLMANGGKAFSFSFLPSTLWAYWQPFGLHFSGLFPFITPPTAPAAWLNGAVLDQTYPTASVPATMPLLFLLSCWGVVTAFRPRGLGQVRLTRILLVAAAAGAAGVLLWGYISERYMADFMPFLILASAIGLIDVWRRLASRGRRARRLSLGVVTVFALYCIGTNVAIAAEPEAQWTTAQNARFVTAERLLSIQSLGASVRTGPALPYWAPAGQLFAVNHCSGLYLSTGDNMTDVPGQQIEHYTWTPVEQSSNFTQVIGFTFNRPESFLTSALPLMKYGASTLVLRPDGPGQFQIAIEKSGTSINWPPPTGFRFPINVLHQQYQITVTTDPNLKSIIVTWYGDKMIGHYLAGDGPAIVQATPASSNGPTPAVTVAAVPTASPSNPMQLCRSLVGKR
jgi:hypothetical protein